ncbi:hypothetical protein VTK73DRAFT_4486 [Phialemonium thermophilum]|uniref:Uncharacterized protein n=1 Tax=Phialemonium thermophilum TaxID=223376 RepID=A0ABR3V882_9PEZI
MPPAMSTPMNRDGKYRLLPEKTSTRQEAVVAEGQAVGVGALGVDEGLSVGQRIPRGAEHPLLQRAPRHVDGISRGNRHGCCASPRGSSAPAVSESVKVGNARSPKRDSSHNAMPDLGAIDTLLKLASKKAMRKGTHASTTIYA